jgi:hypothetical protein
VILYVRCKTPLKPKFLKKEKHVVLFVKTKKIKKKDAEAERDIMSIFASYVIQWDSFARPMRTYVFKLLDRESSSKRSTDSGSSTISN